MIPATIRKMSQEFITRPSLLLRVRDHEDQDSWTEFVEIYGPLIHRFALNRGVSLNDAPDITQDVLRNVARAMQNFEYDRSKGTFRSWLFTVIRREIIRNAKKAERQASKPHSEDPTKLLDQLPSSQEAEDWEKDYQKQLVGWAMDKIEPYFSEKAWKSFILLSMEGCPAKDVAARLDTSPGSVYVYKSRVLKRLTEAIRSVDEDAWELELIGD